MKPWVLRQQFTKIQLVNGKIIRDPKVRSSLKYSTVVVFSFQPKLGPIDIGLHREPS